MTSLFNNTTPCEITTSQEDLYETFSWWISGIGSICVSSVGLILNIISAYILCQQNIRSSFFNRLLTCLVVVDSLFLVYAIFNAIGMQLQTSYFSNTHPFIFVYFVYPTRSMIMCASIYMTVGLSYERYNSVRNPITVHQNQGNDGQRLFLYVTSLITLSIVYCIPKFFELKVESSSNDNNTFRDNVTLNDSGWLGNDTLSYDYDLFEIRPTELRQNPHYILWYINVSNLVVTGVMPAVLLSFLNFNIYKSLRQRRQRKPIMATTANVTRTEIETGHDRKQTSVLFTIVLMDFICNALRVILNIEELLDIGGKSYTQLVEEECGGNNFWAVLTMPISMLLLEINAGSNFFIYCVFDVKFTELLKTKCTTNLTRTLKARNPDLTERNAELVDIELHAMA